MADNTQLPIPTTSGDVIASDDIGGVKFQRVKMIHGADGVNDGDVSSVNPMPIIGTISDGTNPSNASILLIGGVTAGGVAQTFETNASGHLNIADGGGSITVDGTFWQDTQPISAASLPLPTGAATQSLQQEIRDLSDSINTLVQFLYANSPRIDVAGRVASNGSEVTQPVSGTVTATVANATIASGTLTNITQLSTQPVQYLGQDVPLHIYDNIKVT